MTAALLDVVRPHRPGRVPAGEHPRLTAIAAATVVAAAGCGLLAARPALTGLIPDPTALLIALFAALLTVGVAWPLPAGQQIPASATRVRARNAGVLLVGVSAFAFARVSGGGEPPLPALGWVIALNTLAAVAEEAFFRRFIYGVLLPSGTALAVVGSAALFALVHVTIYGLWVLPIDLAAGLLLSWQRLASGSWRVPALTHALANVLVVI